MDASTLTDRYVAAAMRTVPESQRPDLSAELRASIDDQVDARIASGEAPEAAERAVLTDLGDPDRLAAGYTDRPLWLVGPRYFLDWWRLLKLLLWIVPPLAAFGVALGQTLSGAGIGQIIGTTVATTLSVIVHVAFWTTLVFAIVERASTGPKAPLVPWSLDQLPEPHQAGARFADMIASIVFLLIGAGAILWDLLIGFAPMYPGLSLLDPGLWPWWIAALFVVMGLEALLQIVVFLRSRWTYALAWANAALAVVVAVPALWLLSQDRLLNREFWTTVVPTDGAEVFQIVAVITGFVIAAVAVWDIIDAFLKARRAK